MNALPLALSLSSTFTKVGAIAAFAALLGIAILSLLAFSQAREIKRLREWAGRAPERAAELEQRVSADAAARMQRSAAPVAPVRVVPRKTPLVSAPVSTAVHATAAAAVPAVTSPAAQGAESPAMASDAQAPADGEPGVVPAVPNAVPAVPDTTPLPDALPVGDVVAAESEGERGKGEDDAQMPAELDEGTGSVPVPATAAAQAAPIVLGAAASAASTREPADNGERALVAESSSAESSAMTPATAAAQAAGLAARPSLPPSPSSPAPPGAPSPAVQAGSSSAPPPPRSAARPPAPVAAARRAPSRAVGESGADASSRPPRSPAPPRAGAAVRAGAAPERLADLQASVGGPKYFKPERSPARVIALILGGVIVVGLATVLAFSALKGGGAATTATQSPTSSAKARPAASHAVASNPADLVVTVLNGTSTNGLAHHLAGDLQQSGYARAEASTAVPPGTHARTVIEYIPGHRADGQAVARALDVTRVQAIEGVISSLASSATVVVIAGADQAAQLGGGGAQGKGEPATGEGATGEGGAAAATGGGSAGAGESGGSAGEGAAGSGG